ncbi:MAG: D-glycero-beta-D-manno-heptose 1,7-bisphosphate 7-phosphatase [Pseudomonadota bacterium]
MNASPPRLVVLDRDGVINEDSDAFVKSAEEWLPLPGSIEAIARLSNSGFTVTVATNQSGIARGLFSVDALDAMHAKLTGLVEAAGGRIGRIVYCPDGPDDVSECRKPKPGMFIELGEHYGVSLAGVPAIGDSLRDLEAAAAVGARPILVRTGKGLKTERSLSGPLASVDVFDNLAAAAEHLIARS